MLKSNQIRINCGVVFYKIEGFLDKQIMRNSFSSREVDVKVLRRWKSFQYVFGSWKNDLDGTG